MHIIHYVTSIIRLKSGPATRQPGDHAIRSISATRQPGDHVIWSDSATRRPRNQVRLGDH